MSLRRQASFNPTLTNFAQGYAQDRLSALAEFVAPTVRVSSSVGQYKALDPKVGWVTYNTARALGGKATRIEFAATDPTYNCQPQALEIAIDDAERDAAGSDQAALQENKSRTVISGAVLSHEDKVVTLMKTLSAEVGVGQWSDKDASPVEELDALIEALALATGRLPNAVVFGLGAWRVFRNHPKVVSRASGTVTVGVNEGQAAAMLAAQQIEIKVAVLGKDTTKFGATASKQFLIGADIFMFTRSAAPTVYDPSWMKTFTSGTGSVDAVRVYRDEQARSDVLAIDWSEDIKIVGSAACKRLTIT